MACPKIRKTFEKSHDDASEVARVRKVVGQLEGVEKMILSKRHPPHVIQQVKAASSALAALRFEIVKRHLHACLTEASETGNYGKFVEQILETIQMQSVK